MKNLNLDNLKVGTFISFYSSSGSLKIFRIDRYIKINLLSFKICEISEFWKSPSKEFQDFYVEGQHSWFPPKFRRSRINEVFSFTRARINYRIEYADK